VVPVTAPPPTVVVLDSAAGVELLPHAERARASVHAAARNTIERGRRRSVRRTRIVRLPPGHVSWADPTTVRATCLVTQPVTFCTGVTWRQSPAAPTLGSKATRP